MNMRDVFTGGYLFCRMLIFISVSEDQESKLSTTSLCSQPLSLSPLPLNDRLKSASRNDFSFKQWPGRLFNLQLKGIKIINSFSKSQQQKPGHLCLAGLKESKCFVLGEAHPLSIFFLGGLNY